MRTNDALRIEGASENNLRDVTVSLPSGMTAVVGVSGSGKSSLAYDTLYHEARRRFLETISLGSPWLRLRPARVRAIRGLGPALALAQNVLNRNPNSTLATAIGIHPYLRVLYARFAERRCPACGAETRTTSVEEQLAALRTMAATARDGVEVIAPLVRGVPGTHARLLAWLAQRSAGDAVRVDGAPWRGEWLDPADAHNISVKVASVDAHADAATLRAALEEVIALGSPQVVLASDSQTQWLSRAPMCARCGRPFRPADPEDFRTADPETEAYRLGGLTLAELLRLDVAGASDAVDSLELGPGARLPEDQVRRRLRALRDVGLDYLALERPSPSLSRGEAQRVRIALLLANPIEDVLHVLDEPSIGLDPGQVGGLVHQLGRLRGPVVVIEHDPGAVAGADHVVELGPGAGPNGGRVTFAGTPAALWRAATTSGRWFSRREQMRPSQQRAATDEHIVIRGASPHNLREIDVEIPIGRLTVVAGPSGAGKSTLVRDVLVASLEAGRPIGCRSIDGPRLRSVTVTQEPIGRNPRSSAATYSGLADVIRRRFARETGRPASLFSFNRGEGGCPACDGIGSVELKLPYLPSEWLACEVCQGRRFGADALATQFRFADGVARSIADVYELTVDDAAHILDDPAARRIVRPLQEVGLGYL